MSSASQQRIRHVAIVLQSLDATTSRGLLAQLPPEQSRLVRQAMVQMGTVSPQERAAAFQSMQGLLSAAGIQAGSQRHPEKAVSPAAALLASHPAAIHDHIELSVEAISQDQVRQDRPAGVDSWSSRDSSGSWQHMPAEALAEILRGERPIVIATVINQVSVERGKAISQALPLQIAAATLAALPHLHLTDAAVLNDIQIELERKIGLYQAPKLANAEGLSKLKAIVASMPSNEQIVWTNAIAQSNPVLATRLGWNHYSSQSSAALPTSGSNEASKNQVEPMQQLGPGPQIKQPRTVRNEDIFASPTILPFSSNDKTDASKTDSEAKHIDAPKPYLNNQATLSIDQMLELSDRDFVSVLHACQPQTVLLALSGATRPFVARVERLMPSKDVKRLRERLNTLGPLQLREVDAAQRTIAQTAMSMLADGLVGATTNVSFTAAA